MERTAIASKILVLGVDAMDPRLTKKYVEMDLLPFPIGLCAKPKVVIIKCLLAL